MYAVLIYIVGNEQIYNKLPDTLASNWVTEVTPIKNKKAKQEPSWDEQLRSRWRVLFCTAEQTSAYETGTAVPSIMNSFKWGISFCIEAFCCLSLQAEPSTLTSFSLSVRVISWSTSTLRGKKSCKRWNSDRVQSNDGHICSEASTDFLCQTFYKCGRRHGSSELHTGHQCTL